MAHYLGDQLRKALRPESHGHTLPDHRPPPLPPRSTRPDLNDGHPPAGTIYPPGQYPTPELPLHPKSKFLVLRDVECNSDSIQNALDNLGSHSTLYLPANTVWLVTAPIKILDHQELATEGYPTGYQDMATLEASPECRPHLLHAFGKTGIMIRNLIVDGKRESYGFQENSGVMIQLGGHPSEHQVLDRCMVKNPRSWSCVQAFEHARNVRITNNCIGPAGSGADVEELKWADGISYAAADGLVAGNLIFDATDGGIVIFGAPGTLFTSNVVATHLRLGLGAINMVDYGPNDGNYVNTRVEHNTIVTAGNVLKIGIGQGCSVWWTPGPDKRSFRLRGAKVTNNHITAASPLFPSSDSSGTVAYGFPIGADVQDWICMGNKSSPEVFYSGDVSGTLDQGYINAAPGPFIHDRWGHEAGLEADISTLTLQSEFVQGKIWGILAVSPGPSTAFGYDAGGFTLKAGERIRLRDIQIIFREDAEVCVVRDQHTVWVAGTNIHPRDRSTAMLTFLSGGKLAIVNSLNNAGLQDLTPHIPAFATPIPPSGRPNAPRLVFSATQPYISIVSPKGDQLYSTLYSAGHQTEYKVGQRFVARSTPHVGGSLFYAMGQNGQFIIAHTRGELTGYTIEWPLDPARFNIVYRLGSEGPQDLKATLVMQGDGNLVIYSGAGSPTWASGTCDDRQAFAILFGIGTPGEPYIELVNKSGQRVWSST